MTKKLEDLLNLPDSKDIIDEEQSRKQSVIASQDETFRDIIVFSNTLPTKSNPAATKSTFKTNTAKIN